jgi:hypothetical protein
LIHTGIVEATSLGLRWSTSTQESPEVVFSCWPRGRRHPLILGLPTHVAALATPA